MKWNHIMEKQPEDGEDIIQCDPPYEGHYTMGQTKYIQMCSFDDVLQYCRKEDLPNPNFYWISKRDFPFPV